MIAVNSLDYVINRHHSAFRRPVTCPKRRAPLALWCRTGSAPPKKKGWWPSQPQGPRPQTGGCPPSCRGPRPQTRGGGGALPVPGGNAVDWGGVPSPFPPQTPPNPQAKGCAPIGAK